jgi:predicted nucleic acid-binding protein
MTRNSVFLDTSGWLALLNRTEELHVAAQAVWLDLVCSGNQIVLTDWVIAETGNALARTRTKNRFSQAVEGMLDSPNVTFVPIDEALLRRVLTDYAKFADKTWGLVDCASFVVMREHRIVEAFTSDVHFAQAGFVRLLKRP